MDNHNEKVGTSGQLELFGRRRSEIPDAERLQTFQGKLYQKAKQENRKSQRKCRLYRQKAFDLLVNQYGLIDPTKYIAH